MTTAAPDTVAALRAVRAELADLRDERNDLNSTVSEAREKLRESDEQTIAAYRASDDFKRAAEASDRLREVNEEMARAQSHELAIVTILGEGVEPTGVNGPTDAAVEPTMVKALTDNPGALLATILERRKADVATLPAELRDKPSRLQASLPNITTANISTVTETDAVIDLLSPASVAIASGIQTLRIDTTKTRVPRFTELPEADWIPELGAFPKNGPGLEMVDVEPPKVGLVTPLSIEVFEDLSPLTLSMIQVQLMRAVALAYDRGILFGTGEDDEPLGVANTNLIGAVEAPPLANLSAFAEAIAALIASNASPRALVMNPLDVGVLLQAVEFSGTTESNVPLWKDAITGPSGLSLPYFRIPIWPTPACPQGNALLYDPATIIAVIRRPADIAIDPYYDFDHGAVGLRVYIRGDVVVGQPQGTVLIEFEPTIPSSG